MSMDIAKFEGEITKIVENILEKQAAAGIEKDVKEALEQAESTITSLKERVVEAETRATDDAAKIESLETAKTEMESEVAAKKDEIEKLTEENKNLTERAENAEKVINDLEKDKLQSERMAELAAAKVERTGDAREKQAASVREMTDEEFAAYKEEMVTLRSEIEASLKADLESASSSEEEGTEDPEESASAEEEGDVKTPPANIEGALEEASAAMPNAENASENKWQNFSTGLADYLKKNRGAAPKDNR